MNPIFTLRALDVQIYRLCDDLSGPLLLGMVIFSPWAFGTTQPWSIWVMNYAGYGLGVMLLLKWYIRNGKKYPAARWDQFSARSGILSRRRHRLTELLKRILAILTVAVLVFILISAVNAAANYDALTRVFRYRSYVSWLPHSFDGGRTWFHFWMYLGLALSFWAFVDWLPGMTAEEERSAQVPGDLGKRGVPLLPSRLGLLLWVLCINGAILGVECIIQRLMGTNQLLFMMPTHENREAIDQFGPYAYRSNAAQYFNMVWPVCLGFWWTLQRLGGLRGKAHHWLLLCAAIMAACPVISATRGGAIVSAGILIAALVYLAISSFSDMAKGRSRPSFHWGTVVMLILFLGSAVGLAWYLGWDSLEPRMEALGEGYQNRQAMFDAAKPMAKDFPLFGMGPGTFATVFQLYMYSTETYWPEQLHNDWLETRITFGWAGLGCLLAALGCVFFRWLVPGGIRGSRRFVVLAWLALGGCLVEALFDFPFQIHSTLFLFLVICAILFGLSRDPGHSRH